MSFVRAVLQALGKAPEPQETKNPFDLP